MISADGDLIAIIILKAHIIILGYVNFCFLFNSNYMKAKQHCYQINEIPRQAKSWILKASKSIV